MDSYASPKEITCPINNIRKDSGVPRGALSYSHEYEPTGIENAAML